MRKIKAITKEKVRDGFVSQFRFGFELDEKRAEKAVDVAMADEELVKATAFAAKRSLEIAMEFGWTPPSDHAAELFEDE